MDVQPFVGTTHTTQEVGKNTGIPLVIKGVDRIEMIDVKGEDDRRDAELYTHALSRIMRRDFNVTSVKLFWFTKGYRRRESVRAKLRDLADEANRLEDIARPYEMPSGTPAATCNMRIVSHEAGLLFETLVQADRALHKLMHSPLAEVAEENLVPFMRAFTQLRSAVFGFADERPQSAAGHSDAV